MLHHETASESQRIQRNAPVYTLESVRVSGCSPKCGLDANFCLLMNSQMRGRCGQHAGMLQVRESCHSRAFPLVWSLPHRPSGSLTFWQIILVVPIIPAVHGLHWFGNWLLTDMAFFKKTEFQNHVPGSLWLGGVS